MAKSNLMQKLVGVVIVVLALGLSVRPAKAQVSDAFQIAPPAAWVLSNAPAPGSTPGTESSESVSYLLLDNQVNRETEEWYSRTIKKFLNASGVQNGARLQFDFDPAYQHLVIHQVVLHRGNDTFNRLDKQSIKLIQRERDLERHIYDGSLSAVLFLEDVRVGDVVDLAYTVRGINPILGGRFSDSILVRYSAAVDRFRFRALWPRQRRLFYKVHQTTFEPTINELEATTEYLWESQNLPKVLREDSTPSWFDAYPWVQLTEFQSWEEVASWALDLYPPVESLPADLLENIEKWKKLPDPERQIRAALEFTQDEIRYLGMEMGIGSHKPSPPATVLSRRFGDCKDKAYLLCTILRRMGITAYPALVNTAYRGHVGDWLPTPYAFNHVVARVELAREHCLIDPTENHQRGSLWARYIPDYESCLLVRTGAVGLTILPPSQKGARVTVVDEEFTIRERDRPAALKIRTVSQGAAADQLREYFATTSLEEIGKEYLNYYARLFPEIESVAPIIFHDDADQNRFEVTERYNIKSFWQLDSSKVSFTCEFYAATINDVLRSPDTKIRSFPLAVSHPRNEIVKTRVVLPEPWPVEPEELRMTNCAAELSLARKLEGNVLLMEYEYRSRTNWVPVQEVPVYLASLEKMREELGYSLSWENEDAPFSFARMNWPMAALSVLYLVGAVGGTVWFYRAKVGPAVPMIEVAPVISRDNNFNGLSGWLLLVGFALVTSPPRLIFGAKDYASFFRSDVWSAYLEGGAGLAHLIKGPVIVFEVLANLTLLVFAILMIVLFFQRRRQFPKLYIGFLLFVAGIQLVDYLAGSILLEGPEKYEARELTRSIIACLIWVPYMRVSKRVKSTFVR